MFYWDFGIIHNIFAQNLFDMIRSLLVIMLLSLATISNAQLNRPVSDYALVNKKDFEERKERASLVEYKDGIVTINTEYIDYTVTLNDVEGGLLNYGMNIRYFDLTTLERGPYYISIIYKTGEREKHKIVHIQ